MTWHQMLMNRITDTKENISWDGIELYKTLNPLKLFHVLGSVPVNPLLLRSLHEHIFIIHL